MLLNIFKAQLFKIVVRPGVYIAIAIAEALVILTVTQMQGNEPRFDLWLAGSALGALQLPLVFWACVYAAAEYEDGGKVRGEFLTGSPVVYVWIRFLSATFVSVLLSLISFAVAVAWFSIAGPMTGKTLYFATLSATKWAFLAASMLLNLWFTAFGYWTGIVLKSKVSSIVVMSVLFLGAPIILSLISPEYLKYAPSTILARLASSETISGATNSVVTFSFALTAALVSLGIVIAAGSFLSKIGPTVRSKKHS